MYKVQRYYGCPMGKDYCKIAVENCNLYGKFVLYTNVTAGEIGFPVFVDEPITNERSASESAHNFNKLIKNTPLLECTARTVNIADGIENEIYFFITTFEAESGIPFYVFIPYPDHHRKPTHSVGNQPVFTFFPKEENEFSDFRPLLKAAVRYNPRDY